MSARNETAYISMGSNLGNRRANLEFGIEALRQAGILPGRISPLFETEPVGYRDQPWFLNLALEIKTSLKPLDLLRLCQEIEVSRGRSRPFTGAPRTLDLDILLYGDLVLDTSELTIPHPRMTERRFVLQPLAEIAPHRIHPLRNKTILSLLESCQDTATVHAYAPGEPR